MTNHRRSMDPSTSETLLNLWLNKDLWDARDIERLKRKFTDDRAAEKKWVYLLLLPEERMNFKVFQKYSSASSSYFDGGEEEDI